MDALILDFDGTVADSEGIHGVALQDACREEGIECSPTLIVGLADPLGVRAAFEAAGVAWDEPVAARILTRKRSLLESRLRQGAIPLYPGVQQLISSVAAHVPVAICTAARRHEVVPVLEHHGIHDFFQEVITVEDVAFAKPDPSCYLLSAERLSVSPSACIAIEDSTYGARAAVDAGMVTIGVTHTTDASRLAFTHHLEDRIGDLTIERLRTIHGAAQRS